MRYIKMFLEYVRRTKDSLRMWRILEFLLFASSSLRTSEVLRLKVSDLDFVNRMIGVKPFSRTKKAWISFSNEEAKILLQEHIKASNLRHEDELFRKGKQVIHMTNDYTAPMIFQSIQRSCLRIALSFLTF